MAATLPFVAMLLLLNGAPGLGKSTLARRWVDDRPLALCLDVDAVRGLLGSWSTLPREAGLAARDLALAMTRTHLAAGHDVVVPQYVARAPFADDLAEVAAAERVTYREVLLWAYDAAVRGADRSDDPEGMVARLDAFAASRPRVVRVESVLGDGEGTYAALRAAVT